MTPTFPRRLSDIPLWRLLVLLHDAERTCGPSSDTARTLARAIRERMDADTPTRATPAEVTQ